MKYKYVGDAESPEKTTVLGVAFVKGEHTKIDVNHTVNGKKLGDVLAGMSHFVAIGEDKHETNAVAPDAKPEEPEVKKPVSIGKKLAK